MKNFFCLLVLLFSSVTFFAQNLSEQFYQAYLTNSIELWKDGIKQLKQEYKTTKNTKLLFEIGRAAYGSVGTCFAHQNNEAAAEMIDIAEEHLETFMEHEPEQADALALMSGVMGFKISLSPIKGMILGSKSDKMMTKAMKLNSESATVQYQEGSSLFYTPAMFGGDQKKAIEHLELARQIHEKSLDENNWEYLNTMATLGRCYQATGQLEKAKETYLAAMKAEPDFGWIKYQLMPNLEKQIAANTNN